MKSFLRHLRTTFTRSTFLVIVSVLYAQVAFAETTYTPLQPLPGVNANADFANYLNALFVLGIATAGVLAVMMIMYGGIKYMTVEAFSSKSDAKKIIWGAVLGLLLSFASWLILATINPQILDVDLDPSTIDTDYGDLGLSDNFVPPREFGEAVEGMENLADRIADFMVLPYSTDPSNESIEFFEKPPGRWPFNPDPNPDLMRQICEAYGFTDIERSDDEYGAHFICSRPNPRGVFNEKLDDLKEKINNTSWEGQEPVVQSQTNANRDEYGGQHRTAQIFLEEDDIQQMEALCQEAGFASAREGSAENMFTDDGWVSWFFGTGSSCSIANCENVEVLRCY